MAEPVYLSINEFPGDGVTTQFEFAFAGGYIDKSHVFAFVIDAVGIITPITITPGMFVSEFTLALGVSAPVGSTMRIYRETPRSEPLVNFTTGARITENNLDLLARQTVFAAAEAFDAGAYSVVNDLLGAAGAALAAAQQSEAANAASTATAVAAAATSTAQASAASASAVASAASAAAALASQGAGAASAAAALASQGAAAASEASATASDAASAISAAAALVSQNAASASAATSTAQAVISTAQAVISTTKAGESAASAVAAAASALAADSKVPRTSATGSAVLPTGTEAQRDVAPLAGYLRFNASIGKPEVYTGTAWGSVGGGATGGASDEVFVQNDQAVTTSYTIPGGKNASTVGPITVPDGIIITVSSGSRWVVL